jgi:hypothetical protein
MKVIVDGIKDNNIRFTCECCSCVFEANENDDGFSVVTKNEFQKSVSIDGTESDYFKKTGHVVYDEFSATETKAICTCPNCGSVALGENTYRRYIGRKDYRVI